MIKVLLILGLVVLTTAFAPVYAPVQYGFEYSYAVFVGSVAGVMMDPLMIVAAIVVAALAIAGKELVGLIVGAVVAVAITVYVAQTWHRELGIDDDLSKQALWILFRTWDAAVFVLIGTLCRRFLRKSPRLEKAG